MTSRYYRSLSFSILLIVGFSGCGSFPKNEGDPAIKKEKEPIRLGVVAAVHEEFRFVIVDASTASLIAASSKASVQRDNAEVAVIEFDKERRRPFISAKIVSGEPKVGDDVVQ